LILGCQKNPTKYSQPYSLPLKIDFAGRTLNYKKMERQKAQDTYLGHLRPLCSKVSLIRG